MPEGSMRRRNELENGKEQGTDWEIRSEVGPIGRVD